MGKPLLVIGQLRDRSTREQTLQFATELGWPAYCDTLSGVAPQAIPTALAHFDLYQKQLHDWYKPDFVVHVGAQVVSKNLISFLSWARPPAYWQWNNVTANFDPEKLVTRRFEKFEDLRSEIPKGQSSEMPGIPTLNELLDSYLDDASEISEISIAQLLSLAHDSSSGLFLASSMPVRLMNMYGRWSQPLLEIGANRGASGIDGTIASAAGYAAGLGKPVTLLIGDLAFLHDLNSLSLVAKSEYPISIIVLNNNGGGIFAHLPVVKMGKSFDKYFLTPHGLQFEQSAKMFGLPYTRVSSNSEFRKWYRPDKSTSSIIEIPLNWKQQLAMHQNIRLQVAELSAAPFSG